jgi:hypothetical protein
VKHFERRTRTRLRLRLPILLLRGEAETPLWTETADISNNGFYCNTAQPFAPGDALKCVIVLPTHSPGTPDDNERLYLEAIVDVVRIVMNEGTGFGIGCEIRQYQVINNQGLPAWAGPEAEQKRAETIIEQLA